MRRVLLIRVSEEGLAFAPVGPPPVAVPIGLLSLAAAARERCRTPLELRVSSLSVDVRSFDELAELVTSWAPDVVGLGALTLDEARLARTARVVKAALPGAVVVAGGPHPTLDPDSVLAEPATDWVVLGEGEETFPELLDAIFEGGDPRSVAGLAWAGADGRTARSAARPALPELSKLPSPAFDLVDLARYSKLYNFHDLPPIAPPYAPLVTSRGCPFHCVYCHNLHGRHFRALAPEVVVDQMRALHERHGVGEFHIVDDIFNFDARRMLAICDGIVRSGMRIKLAFPNGLRGDIVRAEELSALAAAGCYSVCFALETASPRLQRAMRKNLRVERVLRAAELARGLGLVTSCFVMLGFPTETEEELETTVSAVVSSAFDLPRLFKVTPFPGTALYAMAAQAGLSPHRADRSGVDYDRGLVNVSPLPDAELERRIDDARHRVYSEPRRLARLAELLAELPDDPMLHVGNWRFIREKLASLGSPECSTNSPS